MKINILILCTLVGQISYAQSNNSSRSVVADSMMNAIFVDVEHMLGQDSLPVIWIPDGDDCATAWSGLKIVGESQWLRPCDSATKVLQFSEVLPSTEEQLRYRLLVFPTGRQARLSFWVPGGYSMTLRYFAGFWHWPNMGKTSIPAPAVTVLEWASTRPATNN